MLSTPLSIKQVSKYFGQRQVLYDINLDVQVGEIFGLVGVNGVGKTTLIKIMLQLLQQSAGTVEFFGQNANDPMSRRRLAYVPEKFHPSPLLKGMEFLSLALSYHGKTLDEDAVMYHAELLGLEQSALSQRISYYSKGMGQKLGLLAAFLVNVPLLILDEPMSGLDPSARIRLKTLLNHYCSAHNSVFFSSHILSDIEEICTRMAVIHEGKIIYQGTPKSFLEYYAEFNLERAFLKAIS